MKNLFVLLLLLGFHAVWLPAQQKVYMPWLDVINMSSEYQVSVTRLFKTYVDSYNKYEIILPAQGDSLGPTERENAARGRAKGAGAEFYLLGELNRVGDLAILSLALYNTSDGQKVWSSLQKASSPEDLDPVLMKLAAGLGGKDENGAESIYNVSDFNARQLRKINTNNSFGLMLGGGPAFVGGINHNFPAGLGAIYQYDVRNLLLDLSGEIYSSNVKLDFISINAWKPFSDMGNTWFAGGGMGYVGITLQSGTETNMLSDNSSSGLLFFAGGGYLLNRNASTSLRFTTRLFVPTFKVGSYFPSGILITAAILF